MFLNIKKDNVLCTAVNLKLSVYAERSYIELLARQGIQ